MAIIAMAVYDTEENGRSKYTEQAIISLKQSVDTIMHRIIIVDNGSCERTKDFLRRNWFGEVITLDHNIGTAEAINLAWRKRRPGEHCIKIDNDIVVNSLYDPDVTYHDWASELERVVTIDPSIGQVGLKRKDILQNPNHSNPYFKSYLKFLPRVDGDRWICIEETDDIIGSCVLHSSALLDKVGYLYQPGIYGFDDALMSRRSKLAGFRNCFLPHIDIDHIDEGSNGYIKDKKKLSDDAFPGYVIVLQEYNDGVRSVYYNPFNT